MSYCRTHLTNKDIFIIDDKVDDIVENQSKVNTRKQN